MPTLLDAHNRLEAENDAAHQRLTRLGIRIIDTSTGKLRSMSLTERIDLLVKSLVAPKDDVQVGPPPA